jgi:peptidoglycan/xylan/chitin deacetylase (PgdA/CDA1 family)
MIKSRRVILPLIAVLLYSLCPEKQPNTEIVYRVPDNEPVLYMPESFPFVRSVPVPLDEEMGLHLEKFREAASRLQQRYPDSFIISLPTAEKVAALTFDDGPNDSSLSIIKILDNYNVRGTFFFIGELMNKHSETVLATINGGHTVANHSFAHSRPTDLDTDHVMEEIMKAQNIVDSFYNAPKLFRPPYGLVNDEHMQEIMDAGFKVIAWSVDSMDWYFEGPEDIETCVVSAIHPGAVILMHSTRQATVEALPHIIEALQDLGYSFVTLGEALN